MVFGGHQSISSELIVLSSLGSCLQNYHLFGEFSKVEGQVEPSRSQQLRWVVCIGVAKLTACEQFLHLFSGYGIFFYVLRYQFFPPSSCFCKWHLGFGWPFQIQNLQQLTTACCEEAALNIGQWPRESLVMKKLQTHFHFFA